MRPHAALGLLIIACSAPAPDADSNDRGPLRPVVGKFWDIARNPNLGAYDNGMLQQPIAFGIWQAVDGTWQLWASIRNTTVGGSTRLFAKWEAQQIASANWMEGGVAMVADAAFGEVPGGLQAPHVTRLGDSWHMLYADLEEICHAVSPDGKNFQRVLQPTTGISAVFGEGPGMGTRDPMLFVAPNEYRVYYTAGEGADFVRTSPDLATWSPPAVVARGGSAGIAPGAAESPFVIQPVEGGDFFLFRTQRYGVDAQTSVYRSPNPFDFGVDNDQYFIGTLPV
ncbi:MAG TPA: hypothetical protein VMS65_17855, partial [Polyangiaceae bacterium]|nr:hypothetical protein [Polyangiaceae bacterium]